MSSFSALRSAPLLRQTLHNRKFKASRGSVLHLGSRHNSTSNEKPTPTSPSASEQSALADEPVNSSKWVAPKYDYSTDISALRKYTDLNIMKTQGRVYPSVSTLLTPDTAIVFPTIHGSDLNGADKKIPQCSDAEAKVICFSAKEYGFAIVRDWCDPFVKRYNPAPTDSASNMTTAAVAEAAAAEAAAESGVAESSAVAAENVPGEAVTSENVPDNTTTTTATQTEAEQQAVKQTKTAKKAEKAVTTEVASPAIRARVSCQEVVFIEHSLLWFFRSTYAKATMPRILPQQHSNTFLSFGSIRNFSIAIELPNKFTGYVFLLDKQNRIRWKYAGVVDDVNLTLLYKLTEEILLEADLETADAKVQKIFDQAKTYRTEVKKELKESRR